MPPAGESSEVELISAELARSQVASVENHTHARVIFSHISPLKLVLPYKKTPFHSLFLRAMLPLVAWLERQLTRGIWATVDHPNPKN